MKRQKKYKKHIDGCGKFNEDIDHILCYQTTIEERTKQGMEQCPDKNGKMIHIHVLLLLQLLNRVCDNVF